MDDYERLAAENARLKAILSKNGFKITYNPTTGSIARVSKPRIAPVKHTAVTWAKKSGIRTSISLVRKTTGDKAISKRKFKNLVERSELIKDAKEFLKTSGYNIPDKFFNKVPTYVLKNTDFYENVNAILNSTAESDEGELDNSTIKYSMETSVDRIRKANQRAVKPKAKLKLKLK